MHGGRGHGMAECDATMISLRAGGCVDAGSGAEGATAEGERVALLEVQ
jgi:hypothetical protein